VTEREDAWDLLRRLTPARIGLGRSGDGLPTPALLDFQLAHARARDAVTAELDVPALRKELAARLPGWTSLSVRSRALDRDVYLQRPDLGGLLLREDASQLAAGSYDVAFVIADGLSATAVQAHAPETLAETVRGLPSLRLAPLVIARQARVALGDPVGAALGAELSVVLIGERPGLSSPDSLGAYLTFAPRPGRTNAERNCVSNIRYDGLPPKQAGARIASLVSDALSKKISGIHLKDRSDPSTSAESRPELE
jgi:ethanolamine ammonia-lyase small subunit